MGARFTQHSPEGSSTQEPLAVSADPALEGGLSSTIRLPMGLVPRFTGTLLQRFRQEIG